MCVLQYSKILSVFAKNCEQMMTNPERLWGFIYRLIDLKINMIFFLLIGKMNLIDRFSNSTPTYCGIIYIYFRRAQSLHYHQ